MQTIDFLVQSDFILFVLKDRGIDFLTGAKSIVHLVIYLFKQKYVKDIFKKIKNHCFIFSPPSS